MESAEDLEEAQRAFLRSQSDGNGHPAALARRTDQGKPSPAGDDHQEHQKTGGQRHDEGSASSTQHAMGGVLGQIKERTPTFQGKLPKAGHVAGFPKPPRHFTQQESKKAGCEQRGGEEGIRSNPLEVDPRPEKQESAFLPQSDSGDEFQGIAEDVDKYLASMRQEDVEDALQELKARYSKERLEFFRSRGKRKLKQTGQNNETGNEISTGRNERPHPQASGPRQSASVPTEAAKIRFGLDGEPMGELETLDEPQSVPPTERDQLRAGGMDQHRIGYTLDEAIALARSSVPQQRSAALSMLAAICSRCRRGLREGNIPCWNGVSWAQVYEHAFCNLRLLRAASNALSERAASVATAAAALLQEVSSPFPSESNCPASFSEGFGLPEAIVPEQPVWRQKRWKPLEPLAAKEVEQSDQQEEDPILEAADPVGAVVSFGALERAAACVVNRLAPGAIPHALPFLCRCARHSKRAASVIAGQKEFLDSLAQDVVSLTQPPSQVDADEKLARWRCREWAVELARLLGSWSGSMAAKVDEAGIFDAAAQHLALMPCSSEEFYLWKESLSLWRCMATHGKGNVAADDFCTLIPPLAAIDGIGPAWLKAAVTRESFWTLSSCCQRLPTSHEQSGGDAPEKEERPAITWHCAGALAEAALASWLVEPDGCEGWMALSAVGAVAGFLATFCERRGKAMGSDVPGLHASLHRVPPASVEVSVQEMFQGMTSPLVKWLSKSPANMQEGEREVYESACSSATSLLRLAAVNSAEVPQDVANELLCALEARCAIVSFSGAAEAPTAASLQQCHLLFQCAEALHLIANENFSGEMLARLGSVGLACAPPGVQTGRLIALLKSTMFSQSALTWAGWRLVRGASESKQIHLLDDDEVEEMGKAHTEGWPLFGTPVSAAIEAVCSAISSSDSPGDKAEGRQIFIPAVGSPLPLSYEWPLCLQEYSMAPEATAITCAQLILSISLPKSSEQTNANGGARANMGAGKESRACFWRQGSYSRTCRRNRRRGCTRVHSGCTSHRGVCTSQRASRSRIRSAPLCHLSWNTMLSMSQGAQRPFPQSPVPKRRANGLLQCRMAMAYLARAWPYFSAQLYPHTSARLLGNPSRMNQFFTSFREPSWCSATLLKPCWAILAIKKRLWLRLSVILLPCRAGAHLSQVS